MSARTEYIRIRMNTEEKDNLKYLADKWDKTMADTIRELVDQKLDPFRKCRVRMIIEEKDKVIAEIVEALREVDDTITNRTKFGLYCNGDAFQVFDYKEVKKDVEFLLYNHDDLIFKFDSSDWDNYGKLGGDYQEDEEEYWSEKLEEYIEKNL